MWCDTGVVHGAWFMVWCGAGVVAHRIGQYHYDTGLGIDYHAQEKQAND
jgi:hypothetical protein